jgi:HEAT repeat protein
MRARTGWVVLVGCLACGGCKKAKTTDELINDLKSGNAHDRLVAVRLLPQRKGDADKVIPALIGALKSKADDVRWSAAIGLGEFGEEAREAIPALQELEMDGDARVREGARRALTQIDPKQFPPPSKKGKGGGTGS